MVDIFDTPANKILSIDFNQDQSCFAIGTETGFRIFDCCPFQELFQRDVGAGIGNITMHFRTNLLALVGGGNHPKYPNNKVVLWDERQARCVGELSFKSEVKAVKLCKEKMAVVLEQRIYIYKTSDLQLLDVVDTCENPKGLCGLTDSMVVCPDTKKSYLKAVNYEVPATIDCKAHDTDIYALALNQDGRLCATASSKGTLVRIFDTDGLKLLQELRRGTDSAEIQCIAFDKRSEWLASTSDKGTVHIFSLADSHKVIYQASEAATTEEKKRNPKSVFNFMKGIIPYFSSQRSFAQFRIPESQSVVAFGPEGTNSIVVLTYDGKYYLTEFNPKSGGDCKKFTKNQFFIS